MGFLSRAAQVEWTAPISGRVGLWSKADSYVFFDDYTVTPMN